MVKVVCYGREETWENRHDAVDFYTQGMYATAGSAESVRYSNILTDLLLGKEVCRDYDESEGWR